MQSTVIHTHGQLKLSALDWAWRSLASIVVVALGCLSAGLISIGITGDRAESNAILFTWLVLTVVLAGMLVNTCQYCLFQSAIKSGPRWIASAVLIVSPLLAIAIHTNNINFGFGFVIGLFSGFLHWLQFRVQVQDAHWWIVINTFSWALVLWYASQFAA
jgi:hypothetical protein